jgi:hypothetical protein
MLLMQLQSSFGTQQPGSGGWCRELMLQATCDAQLIGQLPSVLLALVLQALVFRNAILTYMQFEILPPLNLRHQRSWLRLPGLFEVGNVRLEVGQC